MNQEEWDKLGVDPMREKHWETPKKIMEKMQEARNQERKNKTVLVGIILGGLCILMTVSWLLL